MSEKKLSIKNLNQKMKKETLKLVKTLEERITTNENKITNIKKKIIEKKRELTKSKLFPTRQKKFELNIIELTSNLEVLMDSKNETITRLNNVNNNLINLEEQIQDIIKHGQTNCFNFYSTPIDDDEIDSGKFTNKAENHITLCENEPMFNAITDAAKDKYPIILKGHTTINDGEPVEVKKFNKDIDQRTISIEKMIDKFDETLEVLFSGKMIKYILSFNKVKRSNYGTGCDIQK